MNLTPIGQLEAWGKLVRMADALPQTLIFCGPAGVGKRRAAKALFQLIECQEQALSEPCGTCVSCRKIAEGKHTDVVEILPKGENIVVDDLREMKKMLFFPPIEAKYRFVIIDDAHKLNSTSANTLLKTLEEPPAHTRFLLVTHERNLLLPTILSRSQFVSFSPLAPDVLDRLITDLGIEIPQSLRPAVLDLMNGGVARASLFADEKALRFLETTQTTLKQIQGTGADWGRVVRLADDLGDAWMLELFLDMLIRLGTQSATAGPGGPEAATASELALSASYLRRRLDRYANRKLIALAAAELAYQNA